MKIRVEPYKMWSGGARAFAERAGVLRATRRQVRKHGDFDVIINWGRNERRFNGRYINDPEAVVRATDKRASMECFREAGVPAPEFTTDRAEAQAWVAAGHPVMARKLLRANSGRGIVLCGGGLGPEEVPPAPLYVRYIKKAHEYRVHVVSGEVVDIQQKRKRLEVDNDEVNYQIRNARNGWVFCRDGVECPDPVIDAAIRAVAALGLDFGAVDLGWNEHRGEATVYEVNTAPGLEGSTVDNYYRAFEKMLPALKGGAFARRRNY